MSLFLDEATEQKNFGIFMLNMDGKGQLIIQGHLIQSLAGLNGDQI